MFKKYGSLDERLTTKSLMPNGQTNQKRRYVQIGEFCTYVKDYATYQDI